MLLQVVFLADFAFLVHRNSGGGSDYFGTTLANQWIVAKSLAAAYRANPGIKVDIQAERFRNDSFGLAVLIALARQTGLPQPPPCSEAIVLPARRGYGIDLILFEQPFLPDQEKDAAGI